MHVQGSRCCNVVALNSTKHCCSPRAIWSCRLGDSSARGPRKCCAIVAHLSEQFRSQSIVYLPGFFQMRAKSTATSTHMCLASYEGRRSVRDGSAQISREDPSRLRLLLLYSSPESSSLTGGSIFRPACSTHDNEEGECTATGEATGEAKSRRCTKRLALLRLSYPPLREIAGAVDSARSQISRICAACSVGATGHLSGTC